MLNQFCKIIGCSTVLLMLQNFCSFMPNLDVVIYCYDIIQIICLVLDLDYAFPLFGIIPWNAFVGIDAFKLCQFYHFNKN